MNIDDEIKKIAFRLRRFREKNNMSREEFCEKTGDNVEYWGCIERGTRSISLKKLINVCRTFHISASEFIDGKSNKNSYEVKKQLILVEFQCYIQENQQELTNEGYEITFMEEEPIRIRYHGGDYRVTVKQKLGDFYLQVTPYNKSFYSTLYMGKVSFALIFFAISDNDKMINHTMDKGIK